MIEEEEEKGGKEKIKINLSKRTYSNYTKSLKKNSVEEPIKIGFVRCSSPYSTEKQIRAKEFLKSKSKWISNNEFKRFIGKNAFLPDFNKQSPYIAPSDYKFREYSKEKWIAEKNFSVI